MGLETNLQSFIHAFEQGRVALTLAFGDARATAPQLRLGADAIFLDGFAPDLLDNLVWWTNATRAARTADAAKTARAA